MDFYWKYDAWRGDYYTIGNPTLRAIRIDKPGYVYGGATVTKGMTFGATETVTNTKLHTLVDDATITGIVNADISAGAAIEESKLDISLSSYVTPGANNAFTGDNTFAGTDSFTAISDLGTVDTADIDGGTLDEVNIGTTTATGEIIVNDSNDYADGLGSQGTSGQVLTSAGTGANPTWTTITTTSSEIF